MRSLGKHVRTLRSRRDWLRDAVKDRDRPRSYERAEIAALNFVLRCFDTDDDPDPSLDTRHPLCRAGAHNVEVGPVADESCANCRRIEAMVRARIGDALEEVGERFTFIDQKERTDFSDYTSQMKGEANGDQETG